MRSRCSRPTAMCGRRAFSARRELPRIIRIIWRRPSLEKGWSLRVGWSSRARAAGVMAAGHGGAGAEPSFGLAIRLPFEQRTNAFIENDPKLINFKYFFTRKLMFVRSSEIG